MILSFRGFTAIGGTFPVTAGYPVFKKDIVLFLNIKIEKISFEKKMLENRLIKSKGMID